MNGTNILLLASAVAVAFFWAGFAVRTRRDNPDPVWWEAVSVVSTLVAHVIFFTVLIYVLVKGIQLNLPLQ